MKKILIFIYCSICLLSCKNENYSLNYPKFYDKYSFDQLRDTLYSDTLFVGSDVDSGRTQIQWYTERISELLADLKSDWQIPDSLYPQRKFDKIKISHSPWEFDITLTNDQANRFLAIINDPVAFDWSETTSETEYISEFFLNGKVINTLSLGADQSVIQPSPGWPNFKKMKFGHLKRSSRNELYRLIDEITS